MVLFNDPGRTSDANCSPNSPTQGQKGITIWEHPNPNFSYYLAPYGNPNSTVGPLYFTFTQPRCYYGPTQVCNVTYTMEIDRESSGADVGPIRIKLNGTYLGDHYHSKRKDHDLTETIDISQEQSNGQWILFNQRDPGTPNYIEFENHDPNVGVYIKGLKIIRVYQMCYLPTDEANQCNDNTPGFTPRTCKAQVIYGEQPDFAPRADYPCNYQSCGGYSWTDFNYDNHNTRVNHGQTISWDWTNPPAYNNYVGKRSCLFNFNNVVLSANENNNDDVKFSIKVNDSAWVDFWHTKVGAHHMAHSVDLATHPDLSAAGGYRDYPNATNHLELRLDSAASVDLILCDGCDNQECPPCEGGKVNLYRVYQTASVCGSPCQTCYSTCYGCQGCIACYSCYIACQEGCEVTCETGCEVSCQSGCEISCQTGCQVSCQTGCEVACQTGCEVACQDCQTGCETICQTGCQLCEGWCEPGCYACQDCQVNCQDCQTGCQVSCQTCQPCENCQTGCQVSCQDACQLACQTCQTGCETICQTGCQLCEGWCEPGCYACQDCQVNM